MATRSTTSLKLDSAIKERVHRLAAARRRSPHWVMREAVEQYVEREEKREQLRQDARAAYCSTASRMTQCGDRRRAEASRCTRSFIALSSFRLVVESVGIVSDPRC